MTTLVQEATTVRERVKTSIKVAQERVQQEALESATSLAFIRGEEDEATRKVTFLEGKFVDTRQAREMAEAKLQGLSNKVVDVNWWREDVERQCKVLVQELTLL
jgi:hypothetical protein